MSDHAPSGWALLLAELTAASVGGHVAHALSLLPPWVGGILGGTVVGVSLRLFGPTLDVLGQRLRRRLAPSPPDDRTG